MHRGSHITLGDTGSPENRVVLIINLPYDADIQCLHAFFGRGFTVVDFVRGVNIKSKKHTVGYVLFATEQERIKAQALSGQWILDREIQIVPAHTGFRISASGDKILAVYGDQILELPEEGEAPVRDAPAVSDLEAFPSLRPAAKPFTGPHAAVVAKHRVRWDLQNRVLFMNNVGQGPEINETAFRLFFNNYTVVDIKRPIDIRTQRPNPTAFVMLASAKERDEALHSLKSVPMYGRVVTLEVPKLIQNVDEFGFVSPSKANVVTFSPRRRSTVTTATPHSSPASNAFTHRSPQNTGSESRTSYPSGLIDDAGFHELLGELGIEDRKLQHAPAQTPMEQKQQLKSVFTPEDNGLINSLEVIWGMSRVALFNRYISQQRTLLPIPEGTEGRHQIIVGSPLSQPADYTSQIALSPHSVPHEPPHNIDTSFRPREYAWGLGSTQSSQAHVLSEEAWYATLPKRR